MALIGEMQYLTIGGKTYSLPAGGGGTVTSVAVSNATNGGLSISGSPISSSGTITIGHSNVLAAAQTTQAVYPIKIDKNGHISEYGNAVTIPTVNDATLTIQKNGVNVETFSANAASNKTANIVVNEVPSGGTSGQVLTKHSATNYDVEWADATGGGVFVVTFTCDGDSGEWSCDTTLQAIYEAFAAGQVVLANCETNRFYLDSAIHYGNTYEAEFRRLTMVYKDSGTIYSDVNGEYLFWSTDTGIEYNQSLTIAISGLAILAYGKSTWDDFIIAYGRNAVVYCRASSASNPASGSQNRLAFMAYVNNESSPTEVEFQYYRSVSSHSDSQQGDQVFVYKLTSAGTWSVTTREASSKIVAGTGLSSSYLNGVLTLTSSGEANVQSDWSQSDTMADDYIKNKPSIPTQASDIGAQPTLVSGTNIKTINNQSLIGSGNITVSTTAAQIIRWTESA